MKLSTDRILTTHVGSLPRSHELSEMLLKRDHEQPYDQKEFDSTVREAVAHNVEHQAATGIDIVSDGEASKVSYATYIHQRLSGFGGDQPRKIALDLQDYPDFRKKWPQPPARRPFGAPAASALSPCRIVRRCAGTSPIFATRLERRT